MTGPYDGAAAPGPRRRRRRRWPIVLGVFAVLLVAILVVADRIAVGVAQDQVAKKLAGQRPFAGTPSVRIHGFPFLTQAIGGKYGDIEVTGIGEPVAGMTGAHVDAHLRGAHIPLSGVGGGVKSVPVDRVNVTITVALTELARVAGVPNLTLTQQGPDLVAQAPVNLPGIGAVTLSGTIHLAITSRGLDGTVRQLRSLGGLLPAGVVAAAQQALHVHVALPNLGYDSALAAVHVSGQNVVLTGSARHVVLR